MVRGKVNRQNRDFEHCVCFNKLGGLDFEDQDPTEAIGGVDFVSCFENDEVSDFIRFLIFAVIRITIKED